MSPFSKAVAALLGRSTGDASDVPRPDRLTYAVGDIHGRLDLLEQLLELIEGDRAGNPADLVFLGDYIDRGPSSAAVLETLLSLELPDVRRVCLMGNHERMFLDFLADPAAAGERWLLNGGRETVTSLLGADWKAPPGVAFEQACRDAVLANLDPALLHWVAQLPLQWRSGTLGCAHAITDPRTPWDDQTEATLLWGRPRANMPARSDGLWVVHGHTVVDRPVLHNKRVGLDTGAFHTGVLSAGRFDGQTVSVLTAQA
ncbi:metallophosphoesterase [Tropicimonas sp. S265A]|uniref:metallophosphoesterase n=1 Tax=Tropicimonas sp. S265A TaxID=3415134 RepID=UPI003C7CBBC8